ncbi:MAG: autotransporter outer membrane beta-barrel domain-containing protein, partial [Verrucomicrobiales bacterium]|nr:autotransporter outer membrane beta-barrel domain-containing protein [Verrucomicrobiales bacterium]
LDHADTARAGGIMVSATNSGTTRVTLNGGSGITGDVTNSGSGMLSLTLNNSQLTGISAVNSSGMSNLTLNNSTWTMTGKSRLTTLHGDNGSITIANVAGADLTVSDSISGRTKLNLTLSNGVRGQQEIHVVVDETNAMNSDTFSLGNSVSAGMQTYGLDNRLDGAWLVLSDNFTGGGDAVLNSAAAVSGMWFTQQDNLLKRMGELRYNAPSKGNLIDNLWVRSYGQQTNINTGLSGLKGFSETQYGVDLGTDKAWLMDDNNTLYTGIFAGYGSADRDFHSGYNGSTDSGYGGLYGTWLHQDGWYADALVKGQYFDTSFDGEDHGSYHSYGVGLSLELGRQFQFADGWFAEPSIQVSYLHLINDNYSTTQGMSVDLDDADIVQFYGGARFGRNIQLNGNGWLQPYVKVGALEQISTGGQVKASGNEWRPTTDGARGVIGAGIVYQLSDADQLHLDYEASFGDKYDKPWGLSAGYRHQF